MIKSKYNNELAGVKTFDFKTSLVSSQIRFSRRQLESMELDKIADIASGDLVYRLIGYFLSKKHTRVKHENIKIPLNWWEHFKKDIFPSWLLKKFPVSYKTVIHKSFYEITNICPHIDADTTKSHIHFAFMESFEDEPIIYR